MVINPASRTAALAAIAALAALAPVSSVRAQTIPMPSVDYETKATLIGGMAMSSRHSNGKMRVEISPPGMQTMVSIIDLRAKKAVALFAMPGAPAMAMEMDFAEAEEQYGVVAGRGKRVGSSSAAGEACDLWQVEDAAGSNENAVACVTRDGIALRVEATVEGKRRTVFEVTELKRTPQDPKMFALPANVRVMQVPKGMMPPRK